MSIRREDVISVLSNAAWLRGARQTAIRVRSVCQPVSEPTPVGERGTVTLSPAAVTLSSVDHFITTCHRALVGQLARVNVLGRGPKLALDTIIFIIAQAQVFTWTPNYLRGVLFAQVPILTPSCSFLVSSDVQFVRDVSEGLVIAPGRSGGLAVLSSFR